MHPAADVAVRVRPKNEVEVVRHQAIGQDAHGNSLACELHQRQESPVVILVVIHRRTGVATIDDVITETTDQCSGCSGHWLMLED